MKQNILILFSIVFLFGCAVTKCYLPNGWLPMPEERIKSYFQINENDTVIYISENNETLSFKCYYFYYSYNPYCEVKNDPFNGAVPSEYLGCHVKLQCISNPSKELEYSLNVHFNRTLLEIGYDFKDNINGDKVQNWGGLGKEFEKDNKKNKGSNYPKYPNEFIEYLTDTIEFINRDTDELTGILVSGKGLAWFTDNEGVKWYLQE